MYWSCKRVSTLLGLKDDTAQLYLYDNADRLMAPFLTNRFLALGGLFVKMGQWVSNMSSGVQGGKSIEFQDAQFQNFVYIL